MGFKWVTLAVVLAIHDEQIAEHGGSPGLRDEGLLDSALHRPQTHEAFAENPDIADLAAVLACGLARNHPFVDGNKRVSAVVTETFLELNGYHFVAEDSEVVTTWLAVATGTIQEDALASWIRERIKAASSD